MTASRVLVTMVGPDRPGIVAAVTAPVAERGWNLEDAAMCILEGFFTILMVVAVPEGTGGDVVREAVGGPAAGMGLEVTAYPLRPGSAEAQESGPGLEPMTVSVHGSDHPGIVHAVASAISDAGGNIVDLSARLLDAEPGTDNASGDAQADVGADTRSAGSAAGSAGGGSYVMFIRALIPSGDQAASLPVRLVEVCSAMGVQCRVQPDVADVL